ncbi:CASP8 [Mytilus edulis]|uniref:CASP8 n=1 Tax=Mytilus edulis TaxID=6550 RepID=A0A8S3UTR4_MYTED|nr:CASP8 [Mytilus edulis]
MNAIPIGIAVIINNEIFDGEFEDRTGTHIDAEKLNKLWTDLKFEVDYHYNLTAAQMIQTACDIARLDHTKYDSLVFCVLTHGANGVLYGKDENFVHTQQIIDLYLSSRCPTLAGKPKLFFIQACQGTNTQEGLKLSTDTTNIYPDNYHREIIPNEADFLTRSHSNNDKSEQRCKGEIISRWQQHLHTDSYIQLNIMKNFEAQVLIADKSNGLKTTLKIWSLHIKKVFIKSNRVIEFLRSNI